MIRLAFLMFLSFYSIANAQLAGGLQFPGPGTAHTVAAALPLDGVSNVKVAVSTRKLLTAYAGFAMRVQRLTGGTQDIGFVANVLDTTSLGTFCSGTTCIVNIWYDQSGNAADFAPFSGQPLEAPVIYTGGAVKTLNGQPAVFWNPSASPLNRLIGTASANPVNTLYVNSVMNLTSTGTDNQITAAALNSGFVLTVGGAGNNHLGIDKTGAANVATSTGTFTYGTAGVYEAEYTAGSGAWGFWIDGAASGTGTNLVTFSASVMDLGNSQGGASLASGVQGEVIEIDQVGTFAGKAALQANQKAYWGTP